MKVRRYLRGSGRVLAFVFVASVIWLLFDMAALRISINDVNSQLLKERVMREKELIKQQSTVTQLAKGVFKHPVQMAELDAILAGNLRSNPGFKVAEVYRQGGRKWDQMLLDLGHRGDKLSKTVRPKYPLSQYKEGVQSVAPKQGIPAKKKVENVNKKETSLKESRAIDGSNKVRLPVVVTNTIKVPAAVQEVIHGPHTADDIVHKALDKTDLKTTEKVKGDLKIKIGAKDSQPQSKAADPVKITPKSSNKDVKGEEGTAKTEEKHVKMIAKSDLNVAKKTVKSTIKPRVGEQSRVNTTAARKPGVHKVLSLDVTLAPRDANAVGQFGQAALVASNEDTEVRKRWDEGYFNVYLSDQIPVDRAIPDTRPEM